MRTSWRPRWRRFSTSGDQEMSEHSTAARANGAFSVLAAGVLILISAHAPIAATAETSVEGLKAHYDMPAQPLSSALKTLAVTADIQVVYAADTLGNVQAQALKGNYTAREALQLLLRDTNLTYVN